MRINNIEYDIDSLFEHSNINNSIEAARKLREATGITLKEAFDILEKYQIGIIDNNSDIKTSSPRFNLTPSSIKSKILLAFLIPACVILIVVFCNLLDPIKPNTNSTIETTQKQSKTESLTQHRKTTNATTTQTQRTTNASAPTVEHRTGENIVGISNKSLSGIQFAVNKIQNNATDNLKVSTINKDIDIEYYALAYAKLYIYDKSQVHAIINFTRNTTTSIKKDENIIYVNIYDYVNGEEHDADLLFTGTPLQQYFVYIDNGDIEKVYVESNENNTKPYITTTTSANENSTTQTQKTTNAPTVEHRTGENIIGISDKSVSGISFSVSKVQNDVTGNWRISTIAENIDIEYYALDYVKRYLHNKSQVHAIVNFTRNTTTSIKKYGNIIYVDIYDYVKGEEHDANRLFTGTLLQQYFVYIDNGDIEKID